MIKYIAPAGTPIQLADIISCIHKSATPSNTLETFKKEIRARYNVKHCFFISTGRAALSLILSSLHELSNNPEKNEVIIPAYTCYSVAASIVKAGLKIRVCDLDTQTLSYDLDKLEAFDFSNVLAVVTANLYGIPNELDKISAITSNKNIYLVDDAAQCLDGKINDKYSGTYGDAGIYSLDKGKNITSMEGGIIVTNSDKIANNIRKMVSRFGKPSLIETALNISKLIIYITLLNPRLYWIPNKLPFLGLGQTIYTTDFDIKSYSNVLASIGLTLFMKIERITKKRVDNAQHYINILAGIPGINMVSFHNNINPVFSRFPILIENYELRGKVVKELNRNGYGATTSYPDAIADIEDIQSLINPDDKNTIGGKMIARQIITLPTHHYVSRKDIDKIASIITNVMSA